MAFAALSKALCCCFKASALSLDQRARHLLNARADGCRVLLAIPQGLFKLSPGIVDLELQWPTLPHTRVALAGNRQDPEQLTQNTHALPQGLPRHQTQLHAA